jgi:hypothetical protein
MPHHDGRALIDPDDQHLRENQQRDLGCRTRQVALQAV